MRTVLVYGDSNVWGFVPGGTRMEMELRWVSLLQAYLGNNYRIIDSGVSGRWAGDFLWREGMSHCNGQVHYEAVYRAAAPVDNVIIALGTNDLNNRHKRPASNIVNDIIWYKNKTSEILNKGDSMPRVTFVLPPKVTHADFDEKKRREVNTEIIAQEHDYVVLEDIDLSEDALHFSPAGHQQVAEAVSRKIKDDN